jgi:hypothetical protein
MTLAKVDIEIREILLGHSIGLSDAYYRPTSEQCLEEYLKVVNDLTINNEFRLSKQVQELKERNQDSEYVIKGKLQEMMENNKKKEEQIKILTSKLDEYVEVQREGRIMSKEIAQRFIDIEQKVNALIGVKKQERQLNREFETEAKDITVKDEKFDRLLETTRERIRKQGELEQHLQQ